MRIESLKTTPDRAGRYWIKLDDGTSVALYRQTVEDFGLYPGLELTQEEWQRLLEHAGQMSAKMRAVRIVSASSVSKRDLQERLVRKGEDKIHAQEAIRWMEELHLLDDRNTAEQVVRSCIGKGYGLQRAKQALYEKRIPKDLWDEVLEDYPDQEEKILEFLRGRLDENSDSREVKKAIDALLRRGHSYGVVRRALNQLSFETDEPFED